jgi:hypothetical protein
MEKIIFILNEPIFQFFIEKQKQKLFFCHWKYLNS